MAFTSVPAAGQTAAFGGLIADNGDNDIVSGFNEDTGQIAFGTGVAQSSSDTKGVKNMSSSATLKGIAVFSYMHAPGTFGDLGTSGINPGEDVRVMRRGRCWVELDPGVSSINPFVDRGYCRYSSDGTNTQIGAWTNSSSESSTNTLDCTRQVVFVSGIIVAPDGSNIAQVECDFTNRPT